MDQFDVQVVSLRQLTAAVQDVSLKIKPPSDNRLRCVYCHSKHVKDAFFSSLCSDVLFLTRCF